MERMKLINSLYIIDLRIILSEKKECRVAIRIILCTKLLNQFKLTEKVLQSKRKEKRRERERERIN